MRRLLVLLLLGVFLVSSAFALSCPPGFRGDWHLCPDYELNAAGVPSEYNLSVPADLAGLVRSITVYPDCSIHYKSVVPYDFYSYLGREVYEFNTRVGLYQWVMDVRESGEYYASPLLGLCYLSGGRWGPCYGLGIHFKHYLVFENGIPSCRVRVRLCTASGCFESVGEGTDLVDVHFPDFKLAFSVRLRPLAFTDQYRPPCVAVSDDGVAYSCDVPGVSSVARAYRNLVPDLNDEFFPVVGWRVSRVITSGSSLQYSVYPYYDIDVNRVRDFLYEFSTDPFEDVNVDAYVLDGMYCSPPEAPYEGAGMRATYCYFDANVLDANMYLFDRSALSYLRVGPFDPNDVYVYAEYNSRHVRVNSPVEIHVHVENHTDVNLPISVSLNLPEDYYRADYTSFVLHPDEANDVYFTVLALPERSYKVSVAVSAAGVEVYRDSFYLYSDVEVNAKGFYCVNGRLYAYIPRYGFKYLRDCPYGCAEDGRSCEKPFWVKHQGIITFLGAGVAGAFAAREVVTALAPMITSPWKLALLGLLAFGAAMAGWYIGQDLYNNHPDCPLAQWAPFLSVVLPLAIGAFESLIALGFLWLFCVFVHRG